MTAHAVHDHGLLTIEQWEQIPGRFELVKGHLVEMTEATRGHGRAMNKLWLVLYFLLSKTPWEVLTANCGVAVDRRTPQSGLIPDVLVFRADVGDDETRTYEPKDVLLAVEVVSPTTTKTDRVDKREEYQRAGVPNYWIVDVREKTRGPKLTALTLVDGAYQEQPAGPDENGDVSADLDGHLVKFNWSELLD